MAEVKNTIEAPDNTTLPAYAQVPLPRHAKGKQHHSGLRYLLAEW
jgi:hypothetical protein